MHIKLPQLPQIALCGLRHRSSGLHWAGKVSIQLDSVTGAVFVIIVGLKLVGAECLSFPDQWYQAMICFEGLLAVWTGTRAQVSRCRAGATVSLLSQISAGADKV